MTSTRNKTYGPKEGFKMKDAKQVCIQLLKAYEQGDEALLRGIYTPTARIWHDFDGINTYEDGAQSVDENIGTMIYLQSAANTISYKTLRLESTDTGFFEIHELSGTSKSDQPYSALACLIGTVEDGKITRLDEFLNASNLGALVA